LLVKMHTTSAFTISIAATHPQSFFSEMDTPTRFCLLTGLKMIPGSFLVAGMLMLTFGNSIPRSLTTSSYKDKATCNRVFLFGPTLKRI